jgi:hypothetical protein
MRRCSASFVETLQILGVPTDKRWVMACLVSFGVGFEVPEPLWPTDAGQA